MSDGESVADLFERSSKPHRNSNLEEPHLKLGGEVARPMYSRSRDVHDFR
jgi:hypothetical protein